ncbi:caspase family protein [Labrys neptuniae]|uniref:caspase family protein n=1 Tax=Labrys neptuniae TaxID=376174 RepID=UPI0028923800|nr:caspase family protein [Labrys neptuniae]MDT3382236.1 caspase family protein [Labrys neptuniae]
MSATFRSAFALLFILIAASLPLQPARAQSQGEKRIALVIGNADYKAGPLATSANDAGLIAQTLQAAGFDVTGARDLDQDSLRKAFREFLDKASASGPDTVAFVYLAGYGLQSEGQNYFVPVDAAIQTPAAVPAEAIRLSDFIRPLGALQLKASIVVIDGARANQFARGDQPLAGGLALVDAEPNSLIAFNAAPGTVGPAEQGPYGAYAQALAEMMRTGGLPIADVFDRTRLRVSERTNGAVLPWSASKLGEPFAFFDRAADAPAPQVSLEEDKAMQSKRIADFDARDAYVAAVDRDTMQGYQDFLTAFPRDPMAKRVRAIVAARREAITWHETWKRDTPNAYWSYLKRYPRGPHAWDARRRLRYLSAEIEPPARFDVIEYDVPPPPEVEVVYVERPVIVFSDPEFDLPPPPPPPVIFLPPPPREFVELPPPPPPVDEYVLPSPRYVAMPEWVRPPRYVEPPPQNFIFNNIHNATVINETLEAPPERMPRQEGEGGLTTGEKAAGAAIAVGAAAAAARVALPPFLRNRGGRGGQPGMTQPAVAPQPGEPGLAPAPGAPQKPGRLLPGQAVPGQALPGQEGQPNRLLPGQEGQPGQAVQPGTLKPGQAQPGQPGRLLPGRVQPGQAAQPDETKPGRAQPGQLLPGQAAQPDEAKPGQRQPGLKPGQGQPGKALPGMNGEALPLDNGKPPLGDTPLPGRKQPGGKAAKPGQLGQPLPGAQPEGQPDQTQPQKPLPGQKGQGRLRPGQPQPDGTTQPPAENGQQLGKPLPGADEAQPLPGRKRPKGRQPQDGGIQAPRPGATPEEQALPDAGAPSQPAGRKRRPAQDGQGLGEPLPPAGRALPDGSGQPQPQPGRRRPRQPDAGFAQPDEPAQPSARRPRVLQGQPGGGSDEGGAPPPRQKRLNQAPAPDMEPAVNAPRQNRQPRAQPELEGGASRPMQRLRPPAQEGGPAAGGGGRQRRCGGQGAPPCE